MSKKNNFLKEKLKVLNSLSACESADADAFKRKLEALKDVALVPVEELEAFNSVRSVNISRGISFPNELRAFKIHLIQSALERIGGHQTTAAQLLGINLTTLHNKLKRLNITPEIFVCTPILHEDAKPANKISENPLKRFDGRCLSCIAS